MNYTSLVIGAVIVVLGLGSSLLMQKNIVSEGEVAQVVEAAVQKFGALSSPDIPSPWLKWGGVKTTQAHEALATATTTPCAIQSPAATSTLLYTALQINTPTTTATTWTVAKAATAFATTTYLDTFSLGSGARGTMFTQATTTGIDIRQVIGPNQWIVWGVAGIGELTSDKLLGVCEATFLEI